MDVDEPARSLPSCVNRSLISESSSKSDAGSDSDQGGLSGFLQGRTVHAQELKEALNHFDVLSDPLAPKFMCKICGYKTDWEKSCLKHMKKEHTESGSNISTELSRQGSAASSVDILVDLSVSDDIGEVSLNNNNVENEDSESVTSKASTVHNNPLWKDELRDHFFELIVQKCSEATSSAYSENLDIQVELLSFLIITLCFIVGLKEKKICTSRTHGFCN